MIPIDKGGVPLDISNNPVIVSKYQDWRSYLVARLGNICSYCNCKMNDNLQIEHIYPLKPKGGGKGGNKLSWDNVLLACGSCNRAKWHTPINFSRYYFPHKNNPLLVFQGEIYGTDNEIITVLKSITIRKQKLKAKRTIKLFNLDFVDTRNAKTDFRSSQRCEARKAFELMMKTWKPYQNEDSADAFAIVVQSIGFFSVAFEIASPYPILMKSLVNKIKGIDRNSFDNNGQPVFRNPTNLNDPI